MIFKQAEHNNFPKKHKMIENYQYSIYTLIRFIFIVLVCKSTLLQTISHIKLIKSIFLFQYHALLPAPVPLHTF